MARHNFKLIMGIINVVFKVLVDELITCFHQCSSRVLERDCCIRIARENDLGELYFMRTLYSGSLVTVIPHVLFVALNIISIIETTATA